MMQAEFLINTEDTVFSFTTYDPLTFHKGDFQVSKECAFDTVNLDEATQNPQT